MGTNLSALQCCLQQSTHSNIHVSILVPKWSQPRNVAGIIRTACILGFDVYIGPSNNYDRLIAKHRDTINHCVMGANNFTVVNSLEDFFRNTQDQIIIMESPEFWKERNEESNSIYTIPLQTRCILVFGDEGEGILPHMFEYITAYTPCYIPQYNNTVKNPRKHRNNVSFNLNSAATLAMGILTSRSYNGANCKK